MKSTLIVLVASLLTTAAAAETNKLAFTAQTETVGAMFAMGVEGSEWSIFSEFKTAFALLPSRTDGLPDTRRPVVTSWQVVGIGVMKSWRFENRNLLTGVGVGEAKRHELQPATAYGFYQTRPAVTKLNGSLYVGFEERGGFLYGLTYDVAPNSVGVFWGIGF